MESLQQIKSRLGAVKNVGQITKAMEIVAATKMRRAQEIALASRPYGFKVFELLEKISRGAPIKNPLTIHRPVEKTLVVIVASDKGLTGAFNTQVFRAADKFFKEDSKNDSRHTFLAVPIGKKVHRYALRKNLEITKEFYGVGDYVKPEEVEPIANLIIEGFEKGEWDRVIAISTHFRTALTQETLTRQILPVDFEKIKETMEEVIPERGRYADIDKEEARRASLAIEREIDYIFEPSPEEAINSLVPHLLKMQIYHLILEANASEHSARRLAMKTASDNADELAGELNLSYNKARQESITKEIIEITSTQTALQE